MEQARIEHAPNGSLLTYITIADAMVNESLLTTNLKFMNHKLKDNQFTNAFWIPQMNL